MAVLYIRGMPAELDERLRRLAAEERRSVNQQVLILLERAVTDAERERQPEGA